jgi:hypothetical protein
MHIPRESCIWLRDYLAVRIIPYDIHVVEQTMKWSITMTDRRIECWLPCRPRCRQNAVTSTADGLNFKMHSASCFVKWIFFHTFFTFVTEVEFMSLSIARFAYKKVAHKRQSNMPLLTTNKWQKLKHTARKTAGHIFTLHHTHTHTHMPN